METNIITSPNNSSNTYQKQADNKNKNPISVGIIELSTIALFLILFPGIAVFMLVIAVILFSSQLAIEKHIRDVRLDNEQRLKAISYQKADEEYINPRALQRQQDLEEMRASYNKLLVDNEIKRLKNHQELAKGLNQIVHDILSMKQDPMDNPDQSNFDQSTDEDFESAPDFDQTNNKY